MLTKDQILVLREQNELTCTKCPPYCLESCDALQTSPSHSLWPNIVFPPTALTVSLGIYRVRLPLPGGREVPGSLSVLSPFLHSQIWSSLTPIWGSLSPSYSGPRFCATQNWTIWGAHFEEKDYKVTNTKSSAKMGKEKALEKINMFNIWYVAQFSENSENSITFLNYLTFLNSFWSGMI